MLFRNTAVVALMAATLTSGVALAGPASATGTGAGPCPYVCFYYNSGGQGATMLWSPSSGWQGISDLQSSDFSNCNVDNNAVACAGLGQTVKNNTATVYNGDFGGHTVAVWYNSGYSGAHYTILNGDTPYQLGNGLYNQDASVSAW
ncbi:peptidase inhibitor family I36 protein [Streptacidiphilus sp. P02-A3a]|uniref:peptidase inhibitor family I36 protein n=1 Tax=Streptacidiphilus sp. P02-A3a TaxID=2704468 RepID=UPI0015FCB46B|nr:peptidase inhibitor family I36 protein [Streptacidiphilus sp. P02-A3a]QMU69594.1 hypothetical protein GXP74_16470 [Streptacidiphilus sp. P02-A3a]